jgi:hypothetical protein
MAKARGGVVLATPKNSAGVRRPWFFSAADYGSYSYSSRQSIFNRPQKKSRTGAPPSNAFVLYPVPPGDWPSRYRNRTLRVQICQRLRNNFLAKMSP